MAPWKARLQCCTVRPLFPELSTSTCFRDSEESLRGRVLITLPQHSELVFSPRPEAQLPFSCLLLPLRSKGTVGTVGLECSCL